MLGVACAHRIENREDLQGQRSRASVSTRAHGNEGYPCSINMCEAWQGGTRSSKWCKGAAPVGLGLGCSPSHACRQSARSRRTSRTHRPATSAAAQCPNAAWLAERWVGLAGGVAIIATSQGRGAGAPLRRQRADGPRPAPMQRQNK